MRGHTEYILPPATKMQQGVYDVTAQVGPLENQHPGAVLGTDHKGTPT